MRKLGLAGIMSALLLLGVVGAGAQTEQTTYSAIVVEELLSITLLDSPILFDSTPPGQSSNAQVGAGWPLKVVVGGESNVLASISIKTTDPIFSGASEIPVSAMEWSPDGTSTWTTYDILDGTVCTGTAATESCEIYSRFSVPTGTLAASYSTGIIVTAEPFYP